MNPATVKIQNVSIDLGSFRALDGVDLELPEGKIMGLIGPSGAGKTTLIRAIVGRQKITQGGIEVLGRPAGSPRLRSEINYMTQSLSVYADLTVLQNLRYFAAMYGIGRRHRLDVARQALKSVDLEAQAGQLIAKLSGGQQQRVSLAVALLGEPKLMVLDEPTVGLDPVLRDQIWRLLRQVAGAGTTIIISSHAMDEAERCDDLVLIRAGRVLAHESPENLCRRTQTQTVEQSFIKLVEARA